MNRTIDYLTAHRLAPAPRSVGSPVANSPASLSSTMRAELSGVGGRFEVRRSTNADFDTIHLDSHVATSCSGAPTACPSNAIGSLVCAGKTSSWEGSCCRRVRDPNRARARSRAASGSAWKSGRPTPFVNKVSPVKTATSFSTYDSPSTIGVNVNRARRCEGNRSPAPVCRASYHDAAGRGVVSQVDAPLNVLDNLGSVRDEIHGAPGHVSGGSTSSRALAFRYDGWA